MTFGVVCQFWPNIFNKICWNKWINQSKRRRSIWKLPLQREIADAPEAIKPLREADLNSRNGWNNNLMMWILLLLNSYFIWFHVLEALDTCFMILLCCFFSSPVLALLIPIQRLIQIPFVRFWNSRLCKSRAAEREENTTNTFNFEHIFLHKMRCAFAPNPSHWNAILRER